MVGGGANLRALSPASVFGLLKRPSFLVCLKKEDLTVYSLEKRFEKLGKLVGKRYHCEKNHSLTLSDKSLFGVGRDTG